MQSTTTQKPVSTPVKSPSATSALMAEWQEGLKPFTTDEALHAKLIKYNLKHQGLNTAKSEPMHGKTKQPSRIFKFVQRVHRHIDRAY